MANLVTVTRPGGRNGALLRRAVPAHTLPHWRSLGWEPDPPTDAEPASEPPIASDPRPVSPYEEE